MPVLKQLIPFSNLFIKSTIACDFFKKELSQKFEHISQVVDAGCQHSDSLQIDTKKSFRNLKLFFTSARLKKEETWLTNNKIDLVISDVASLPIKAAEKLRIPAILIGNFTWHDIYSHLPEAENETHLINTLAEEYSHATLQVLPQCHLKNQIINHKKEVGFISNNGKNVRNDLISFLGKSAENKTLIFIYLGEHGTRTVNWSNLKENKDCIFLTRDSIKHPNVYFINDKFSYHDLIASSDITLTKGGYSTLATAFANHKPVITCERDDFYEFEAVREYLQRQQIGIIVKNTPFHQGDWQESIKKALKLTVKNKIPLNGEIEVAEIVQQMLS